MEPPNTPAPLTVRTSLPALAKLIDHSLLHPTLTDAEITAGLRLARRHAVASACVKPSSVALAADLLAGSPVLVCAVVGFPHGSSTSTSKLREAEEALALGASEIDAVINIGKALGDDWAYVEAEIEALNRLVLASSPPAPAPPHRLKVIFENDYLEDRHIAKLCDICTRQAVAFVKTSTGYGFVRRPDGAYTYAGATPPHLRLMRKHAGPGVEIKAAGGLRTLDDVLYAVTLGVTRVGATATEAILDEARKRGIGESEVEVEVIVPNGQQPGGIY